MSGSTKKQCVASTRLSPELKLRSAIESEEIRLRLRVQHKDLDVFRCLEERNSIVILFPFLVKPYVTNPIKLERTFHHFEDYC